MNYQERKSEICKDIRKMCILPDGNVDELADYILKKVSIAIGDAYYAGGHDILKSISLMIPDGKKGRDYADVMGYQPRAPLKQSS